MTGWVCIPPGRDPLQDGAISGDLATAMRYCGLWPDGRPSLALLMHGGKIARPATSAEERTALEELCAPCGDWRNTMADAALKWRLALRGALIDKPAAVAEHLRRALKARGLAWEVGGYSNECELRMARLVWEQRAAWEAQAGAEAWTAWDARHAREAWNLGAANQPALWIVRDLWEPRVTARHRRAQDARDALTQQYAALAGWSDRPADLLTVGLRDAYLAGLESAMPVARGTLGFCLREEG